MTDNNTPLVSVIVPVYNAEKYLNRCIDSILSQTMTDFELLLIDDGSKDNSGHICDEYSEKDTRVRVLHKTNGGVSSARNLGLDNATGNWITYVDADDRCSCKYLEHLLAKTDEGTDLILSYAVVCDSLGENAEVYPEYRVDASNFERLFVDSDMHWHTSPWAKLYRASIIYENNLRFNEMMHIGEDADFLFSFMLITDKIYVSSDTDYYYTCDVSGSLTKRINTIDSEITSYRTIRCLVNRTIQQKNIKGNRSLDNLGWLVASYVRRVLNSLYYNDAQSYQRIDLIKSLDIDIYLRYSKNALWKEQVGRVLLYFGQYRLYDLMRQFVASHKSFRS